MQLADQSPGPDGHRTMILTWNPDKFLWDEDEYLDLVEQTAQGVEVPGNWSTGNRTGGVSRGDRVFLLRQGAHGRGIIARGTVVKEISSDAHWDGSGRAANYVGLVWQSVLPVEYLLPTEVLKRHLPEQHWRSRNSGIMVKAELVSDLEQLWSSHVARLGRQSDNGQSQGQSHLNDAVRQKKIEDATQNRLMEHYRNEGWTVTDTRRGNPFDAVARRSGPWVVSTGGITTPSGADSDEVLYLEAKGTQSAGSTVLVTRGEVEHARANKGPCVMGIWAGMEFGDDDEVDWLAGSFQVIPFNPHDHDLTAVSHELRPPSCSD